MHQPLLGLGSPCSYQAFASGSFHMGSRVWQTHDSPTIEVCLQTGYQSWDYLNIQSDWASSEAMQSTAAVAVAGDCHSHMAQPG